MYPGVPFEGIDVSCGPIFSKDLERRRWRFGGPFINTRLVGRRVTARSSSSSRTVIILGVALDIDLDMWAMRGAGGFKRGGTEREAGDERNDFGLALGFVRGIGCTSHLTSFAQSSSV